MSDLPLLRVLSLGWGVQSWTLAAMSALGVLPPLDVAIHSDTGFEMASTYKFAAEMTPWLLDHGVKVVTVSRVQSSNSDAALSDIPAYTVSVADGVRGQLRRQCTGDWKIQPMRRYISSLLRDLGSGRPAGAVEQWLGITLDEAGRAKDSNVKYIRHRFPFLEKVWNGRRFTRQDCIVWLQENSLPVPGKSACTFCPLHNKKAWESIKRAGGADWDEALRVDSLLRDKRPPYPLFVHRSGLPLDQAVSIAEDFGAVQLDLFAGDSLAECDSGFCFL